jgi:hypothetical protein
MVPVVVVKNGQKVANARRCGGEAQREVSGKPQNQGVWMP